MPELMQMPNEIYFNNEKLGINSLNHFSFISTFIADWSNENAS